jgi:hypothetical protein
VPSSPPIQQPINAGLHADLMLHARLLYLRRHASLRLRGHFAWFLIVEGLYFGILSMIQKLTMSFVLTVRNVDGRAATCCFLWPVVMSRPAQQRANLMVRFGTIRLARMVQTCVCIFTALESERTVARVLNPAPLVKASLSPSSDWRTPTSRRRRTHSGSCRHRYVRAHAICSVHIQIHSTAPSLATFWRKNRRCGA